MMTTRTSTSEPRAAATFSQPWFATIPCEIFCHFGLQTKRRSPFAATAIFGITNGDMGYCPTIEGAMGGSWEGTVPLSSRWGEKVGYQIVDEWCRMLFELKAE